MSVRSPNTPNRRHLEGESALDAILAALQEVENQEVDKRRQKLAAGANPLSLRKPILVKVAPDLSFEALDEILELAGPRQIAGIVATNTTLSRPDSHDPNLQRLYAEPGG